MHRCFATESQLKINKRKTLPVCEVCFIYKNLKMQNTVLTHMGKKRFSEGFRKYAGNKSYSSFFNFRFENLSSQLLLHIKNNTKCPSS